MDAEVHESKVSGGRDDPVHGYRHSVLWLEVAHLHRPEVQVDPQMEDDRYGRQ